MGNNSCCFRDKANVKQGDFIETQRVSQNRQYEDSFYTQKSNKQHNNSFTLQDYEYFNNQNYFKPRKISQQYQHQQTQKVQITPQDRLLVAVSYLIEGKCKGLRASEYNLNRLKTMIETKVNYCYFNSDKLGKEFNMVELKGETPDSSVYNSEAEDNDDQYINHNSEQQQQNSELVNNNNNDVEQEPKELIIYKQQNQQQEESKIKSESSIDLEDDDEQIEEEGIPQNSSNNNLGKIKYNISQEFWKQMEYFYQNEFLEEDDEFKMVAILDLPNGNKYPIAIQKQYNNDLETFQYIIHDLEEKELDQDNSPKNQSGPQNLEQYNEEQQYQYRLQNNKMGNNFYNQCQCKDMIFLNKNKFDNYLDMMVELFQESIQDNSKISIQLINFREIYDKSSSNYSMSENEDEEDEEEIEKNSNKSFESFHGLNNNKKLDTSMNNDQRPTCSTNFPTQFLMQN